MIRLARMWPGVSRKSGRRYLRGRDKSGNQFWLMEDPKGHGWILAIDPTSRRFEAAAISLDLNGERLFEPETGLKPALPNRGGQP